MHATHGASGASSDTFLAAPLRGKRVLVTRAQAQAHDLEARLQALGAVPVPFPTIHITAPKDGYAALDRSLLELAAFDWVVFTSVNGVDHVWQRLAALGLDGGVFGKLQLAAIGPATAAGLAARGLQSIVVPKRFVAEALLEVIPDPAGKRFLLPRAALARDTLRIGLQQAGAHVVEAPAYDTILPEPSAETLALLDGGVDVLTFTASSTVRNFVAQLGHGRARSLARQAQVAAIGPITAETARGLGLRVDVVASEYTIGGLVTALVDAAGTRQV